MEEYITVSGEGISEIVIERSRFIGSCKEVASEEQAKEYINYIKKKYYDATHNCYAFVTGQEEKISRYSDDGEPQGTAGLPILEVIKGEKLTRTAVVVTRYVGGIKLGTGGLVRAYSSACAAALKACGRKTMTPAEVYEVNLSYDLYPAFLRFARAEDIALSEPVFSEKVSIEIILPSNEGKEKIVKATDFMLGKISPALKKKIYYSFDKLRG